MLSATIELTSECQRKVGILLGEDVTDYYLIEEEVISTVRGEVKMRFTSLFQVCNGRIAEEPSSPALIVSVSSPSLKQAPPQYIFYTLG